MRCANFFMKKGALDASENEASLSDTYCASTFAFGPLRFERIDVTIDRFANALSCTELLLAESRILANTYCKSRSG
jgi:hypothetical protein